MQIDSRLVGTGDLFVAIGRGADFRAEALARGAAATLVSDDPPGALAALAGAVRSRSGARVVGITGTNGKTSTKDILRALCAPHARTVAAERSFNNELGVPLTLCRLELDTEICILELAMRGLGQIAVLCAVARPEIGIITSIGPVHLELLGSVANVARAKAELLEALPAGGTAIVPVDAPELAPYLRLADVEIVRFGRGGDIALLDVALDGPEAQVEVEVQGVTVELRSSLSSSHQLQNLLAALGAYRACGLPLARAGVGAAAVQLSPWRGEELRLPGDVLVINDAYNANPDSMRAALASLAARGEGGRRVAVLGDMAELGPAGPAYHREVGEVAGRLGIEVLLAVGPLAAGYLDGAAAVPLRRSVPDADAAERALRELLQPGDRVLVKASRAAGLERLVDSLAGVTA